MPEEAPAPNAFDLLAPGVQRRLWDMKWTELRPIQADAIRAVLGSRDDLVLMAETAGGKTEAAFLPLLSQIADEALGSVRVVYVGPLKALINDQFSRIEDLCKHLEVPVHRWHGDVGEAARRTLIQQPGGVLLITPESIESLLVNRTANLSGVFGGLRAVVIDELHAFLDASRGLHLASVLARLSRRVSGDRPRMIGLSATIGDTDAARRYLSPDAPERVRVITDPGETKELQMRLHVYRPAGSPDAEDDARQLSLHTVAADLVEHCHGRSNLVFCNAKGDIELLADEGNTIARASGLVPSFVVHHGSLSREIRDDTESRMKSERPYTAICSSTLEMGIDIGSVHTVGQVGPPWGVASLKQRLGRSGRRDDEPRRLRMYVIEDADPHAEDPVHRLPLRTLQSVAVVELMLRERWLEPPALPEMDLSTLSQQVVALIAERGGVTPAAAYEQLCVRGPFRAVETAVFADLLRSLGAEDVIEQAPRGELILGLEGEHIRTGRGFYAVFDTPVEYRLVHDSRELGTLPSGAVPAEDDHLIFAGRRWKVVSVDADRQTIYVQPARGRKRPLFLGSPGHVHRRIRERMLEVLIDPPPLPYATGPARELIAASTSAAEQSGYSGRRLTPMSDSVTDLVTWTGTREQLTILSMLSAAGLEVTDKEVSIRCRASVENVRSVLETITDYPPPIETIARAAIQRATLHKYDYLLSEELRGRAIAANDLTLDSALELLRHIS